MAYFSVHKKRPQSSSVTDHAHLHRDGWDDFGFKTTYFLTLFDEEGTGHQIGYVKIGQFGMKGGFLELPKEFDELDEDFFSLGQDDSYYVNLKKFNKNMLEPILCALRDVAFDQPLFKRALEEDVTKTSLLRSVHQSTVTDQFHRLARGGPHLIDYSFEYTASYVQNKPFKLNFNVKRDSNPPTNIYVLIGRNGVGKTHLLNNMVRAALDSAAKTEEVGTFSTGLDGNNNYSFSGMVFVSFSAFDEFEPPLNNEVDTKYVYVGLKKIDEIDEEESESSHPPKTTDDLTKYFVKSSFICQKGARLERWKRALARLDADPIFHDEEVLSLAKSETTNKKDFKKRAAKIFNNLSSGHKIVLLTITKLVETVEEKTFVLLDEPEVHLHPPLLSAFIRTLSELLLDRNGVALIATHSPVVLQEVPKSCVWVICRKGKHVSVEHPEIDTFGENVGTLTREAFGLEVEQSGFHEMLREAVKECDNYDAALWKFRDEIGFEARAIIQALLAVKNHVEDENS